MVSHILGVEAAAWFAACEADNSREFWAARREEYVRHVREPLLALLCAAGEDPADWRVYRPHRDTRFGGAGGPLKTFLGALRQDEGGTGRYLQVDARGLLASSGLPYLAADQLPRWREAVAGRAGAELAAALQVADRRGCRAKRGYPDPLKRVPRGFDPDHERADMLRWKGVEVWARLEPGADGQEAWLRAVWSTGEPLCAWLRSHVGETAMVRP